MKNLIKLFAIIVTLLLANPTFAKTEVIAKERMSFAECNAKIRQTAVRLGVAPINIVETAIL